jgi:Family of unknown function (DUF5715)
MNRYVYIIIAILIIIITGFTFINLQDSPVDSTPKTDFTSCDHVKYSSPPVTPSDKLNDLNSEHLIHAKQNGLKNPFQCDSDFYANIDELVKKSILIKISENKFYQLKELTYSHPYLIPEAADMLNEIGYRFQKAMEEKHLNHFKFRITSLLRTEQMQSKLCHHNRNATKSQTAHMFGTTVDISYKNFYCTEKKDLVCNAEAVHTLTKVLIEMRQECKILAVREHKQSCFHLTVVVCQPLPENK